VESLWANFKWYRKAAEKYTNTCSQPIGEEAELPSGFRQKRLALHFCFHLLIVEEAVEYFKNA
jgi:hypothetical protein